MRSRSPAVEWGSREDRVNAVGPGYVATELLQRLKGENHAAGDLS